MKKAFSISVKEPCSENFINFKKTKSGGYCNSCQKEVIDFTRLSNLEITKRFENDYGKTCGRFKTSQLRTYKVDTAKTMSTNIFFRSLGIASFSLLALCTTTNAEAQDNVTTNPIVETQMVTSNDLKTNSAQKVDSYTVLGTVLDESNLPLPGVNVILKGSTEGTLTDYDGKFEFPSKLKVNDVLVFSYIGYDNKEYKIKASETNSINITIIFDTTDIELMGDVVIGGAYKSKRNIFQKFIGLFK